MEDEFGGYTEGGVRWFWQLQTIPECPREEEAAVVEEEALRESQAASLGTGLPRLASDCGRGSHLLSILHSHSYAVAVIVLMARTSSTS